MKQLGISFGSIFLLFCFKSSRGRLVAGENPQPPPLDDSPVIKHSIHEVHNVCSNFNKEDISFDPFEIFNFTKLMMAKFVQKN